MRMDTRNLTPHVGPDATRAIRRAQALNAEIDETLDPEQERLALRLWRPLAARYPDDLAVAHGHALALGRVCLDRPTVAERREFVEAAERLLAMDAVSWDAPMHAGQALLDWSAVADEPGALARADAAFREAERRAGRDAHHRALALAGRGRVARAQGHRRAAERLAAKARKADPRALFFDDWDE
jgi:hypothetical protein